MKNLSRRAFLKNAAVAAAAPYMVPASVFGKHSPAERITMGLIGCGGQGNSDMGGFLGMADVQVVAVCDVDSNNVEKTKKRVEDHYAKKNDNEYKGCTGFKDFRELCARKDIDAIIVATPDHWHYLTAVEGVRNKKHVYRSEEHTSDLHSR